MNKRMICALAWLSLVGTGSAPAAETPKCLDEETLLACFQRVQIAAENGLAEVREGETEVATRTELAVAKTSADSSGTGTASTLTDFAQLFDVLGLLSADGAEGNLLNFDLNFLLPFQKNLETNNSQLKLLVNTQPEPLGALVESFEESIREARKAELQKDIPTFGDQEYKFSWSLVTNRFGRDFSRLRKLIGPVYDGAAVAARAKAGLTNREQLAFMNLIGTQLGGDLASAGTKLIGTYEEPLKSQLVKATLEAGKARGEMTRAFDGEIATLGLDRLAELVEQQDQLLLSASHKARDDVVGPDETSVGVTWEFTGNNLWGFLSDDGKVCTDKHAVETGGAAYDACVKALGKYLENDFQHQWRFKLEAAYKRVDAVTYSYPDYDVALALPKNKRVEVTFGAGREFSGARDLGRLDFELSYDSNVDNDTTNKDRLKATVTLTKRVGDLDVPFSLVYANKNEYLGEVDHQIGMHVGVKFRQPD
jgi:hypothetical protein